MRFRIKSRVYITGIGYVTHEHTQEFAEDSNVFGRILEYHQYMDEKFPKCNFEMIEAEEVEP